MHRMSSQSTLIQLWVCWHCAPSKCFITTRPYNGRITELCRPFVRLCLFVPRAGSGIVRIDPLRFLTGCRTRRLNQALSVLSLSLDFYECLYCAVNYGPFLRCVILFVCVFCLLVVLVMLSVTVQVIDWKDSSTKWPIMCWYSLLTHSLTSTLFVLFGPVSPEQKLFKTSNFEEILPLCTCNWYPHLLAEKWEFKVTEFSNRQRIITESITELRRHWQWVLTMLDFPQRSNTAKLTLRFSNGHCYGRGSTIRCLSRERAVKSWRPFHRMSSRY